MIAWFRRLDNPQIQDLIQTFDGQKEQVLISVQTFPDNSAAFFFPLKPGIYIAKEKVIPFKLGTFVKASCICHHDDCYCFTFKAKLLAENKIK